MTGRPGNGRGLAAVLPVVTFVVSFAFSYGPDALRMTLPGALAISLVATGAVRLSAHHPVAALALVTVLALGLPVLGSTFAVLDLVVVFVAFQAVLDSDLRPWAVSAVALVALTVNDAWLRTLTGESFLQPSVLYPLLLTALSVGLGLQGRHLRDADHRRAVADERRRIARDLHDVAAHHLSALVVRNDLARRLDTPGALRDAALFTAGTAAEALDALRQVVHVLNTDGPAPLAPVPRLTDVDDLVVRMAAAGLEFDGPPPTIAPTGGEVDVAVVRIVGEALANVLQHRGPGRCWLDISRRADAVAVTVEDDGPATWDAAAASRHRPGHYGLIGMRERAEACGGHLEVGPSRRGGWRVSALLPVRS